MILINGRTLETQSVLGAKLPVRGKVRPAVSIRIAGSDYETLARLFSGDSGFWIREEAPDSPEGWRDFDYTAYTITGDITDHRDGSFTVVMGRQTEEEEEIQRLKREITDSRVQISRLEERLSVQPWTEITSGTQVDQGTRVRYLGGEFMCVKNHTKQLDRAPGNGEFWTPDAPA